MDKNKTNEVIEILNKIMEYELSGVVRYTHYALMITGRDRISLAQFFKDQASESLLHAQEAGEIITGLEGHPSVKISIIEESNKHSTLDLLNESSNHEKEAVALYKLLLDIVKDESIYIEEYARGMIKAEEMHAIEVSKMLQDFSES
jgi:bacterioferritin